MSYLCVKNEITDKIVLAYQCGGILTKIMENFHDLVGFHHLSKTVVEWIHCL